VDVDFGPQAPVGKETNGVQTMPGRGWNTILRLSSPLEPWLDRPWRPALEMVVRANLAITSRPLGKERWVFAGAREETQSDIQAVRALGAHELVFDATFSPGVETEGDFLKIAKEMRLMV